MAVLAFAIISFCLSACSEDEDEKIQVIRFTRPVLTGISRANVIGCEQTNPYDEKESFRVFGVRYGSDSEPRDVFSNFKEYGDHGEEAVYHNETETWNTEKIHLWDYTSIYAFRAYSPADIEGARYDDTDTGLKIDDYTIPQIENQYDLLYAPAVYGRKKYVSADMTNSSKYNEVNLIFKHALSSIHFKVRTDPRFIKEFPVEERAAVAARYTIRSIKIKGVYNKASFDEKAYATKDESGKILNISNADPQQLWYGHTFSDEVDNSYEFLDPSSPICGVSYKDEPLDITEMADGARMGFMIPQNLPENAEIRVEWTYTENSKSDKYVSVFLINDAGESQKKIWKTGRRYVYTLAVWDFRMDLEPAKESIIDDSDIENL